MAEITGRLEVKLPWWWSYLISIGVFVSKIGVPVQADSLAAFIVSRTRFEIVTDDGKRLRA